MRTALIRPYSAEEKFEFQEPLGAEALCGFLRQHHQECRVFDRQLDRMLGRSTLDAVCGYDPDVVGFSLMTEDEAWDALRLLQMLDNGRRRFCAGGIYVTGNMEAARAQFPKNTRLMRGMGETQLLAFVTGGEAGPVTPDDWAFPARDEIGAYLKRGGTLNIRSSVGCYGKCTFCLTPSLPSGEHRWQGRSVEAVAEEMAQLARDHDPVFNFVDDTFGTVDRVLQLTEALKRRNIRAGFSMEMRGAEILRADETLLRKLHEGGLCWLFTGLESLDRQVLRAWRKPLDPWLLVEAVERCRRVGIGVATGYILWHGGQTPEGALREMQLLHEHRLFSVKTAVSRMGLFPGSELYQARGRGPNVRAEPMSASSEAAYSHIVHLLNPLYPLWFRLAVRMTDAFCRDYVHGTKEAALLQYLSDEMNTLCADAVFSGKEIPEDTLLALGRRLGDGVYPYPEA